MSATEIEDPVLLLENNGAEEPGSLVSSTQSREQLQSSRKRKHQDVAEDMPTESDHTIDDLAHELRQSATSSAVRAAAAADEAVAQQLVEQKYYCTVCKDILPTSAFYPSYIQRHLSWCKNCARAKQAERKEKKQILNKEEASAAVARSAPTPPDHTRSMLERFRRGCSQTSHLEGLSKHLTVGFDAKVARPLLAFWKWQTALKPAVTVESGDKVQHEISGETRFPSYQPLRWIVWRKNDLTPIMPWEVIPVTHDEASLFRNVPVPLRSQLVSDINVLQQIEQRLSQLQDICLFEPGLAMCNLLARHNLPSQQS